MQGATLAHREGDKWVLFQSTPPVRGATQLWPVLPCPVDISIHAPRAGGDIPDYIYACLIAKFQSTPPMRGATVGEFFLIASKWQPFVGLTFGV